MKASLVPRSHIYDLYWKFASERQAIFERRVAGKPRPWTHDQVLQKYKFCNVYRAADRVSQYLIREIACSSERLDFADRAFQIVACRVFSRIETWDGIRDFLGRGPKICDLESGQFLKAIEAVLTKNGGLYTGAFILCANAAYGFDRKHLNHIALFQEMFVDGTFSKNLKKSASLSEVFNLLRDYPLFGDFMAYQIAIDLNYSDIISFSENDFTKPGPGALRGIKKAFESLGDYSPEDIILWMVDRQDQEFERLNLEFNGLWGRPLHAIDCQGLFCELDKYCREAAPDLPSARKRIKAKYSPGGQGFTLFFPPKWGINGLLPQKPVFGNEEQKLLRPQS